MTRFAAISISRCSSIEPNKPAPPRDRSSFSTRRLSIEYLGSARSSTSAIADSRTSCWSVHFHSFPSSTAVLSLSKAKVERRPSDSEQPEILLLIELVCDRIRQDRMAGIAHQQIREPDQDRHNSHSYQSMFHKIPIRPIERSPRHTPLTIALAFLTVETV